MTKVCPQCKIEKSSGDYYKRYSKQYPIEKRGKYLTSKCKQCTHTNKKVWDKLNPDKLKSKSKRNGLKRNYNITINEYNDLLAKQNYKCDVCKLHRDEFKYDLGVDHCHKTGKVRGLLCGNCNMSIGGLKDNKELLKSAIEYLVKYE